MKIILWSASLVLSVGFSHAQVAEKKPTFKERFDALGNQYLKEEDKLQNPKVEPKTPAEARKNFDELKKLPEKYFDKFFDLAKSDPKDALAAKCSVNAFGMGNKSQQAKVIEFWLEHCADKPELIPYFQLITHFGHSADYCKRLAEKTKTRSIKGMALYAPAEVIILNYEKWYNFDKKEKSVILPAERMKLVDDAAKQIHAVLKEYGAEKFTDLHGQEKTIAEIAQETLYLAEQLALGRTAPEFEAESLIDGKKHKLSDYRGKIVVLDFYFYNGGYTHDREKVIPALRRTIAKFTDQPVQVLSISVDEKKDSTATLFQMEKNLPWPQLWDGNKKGIAERYQVSHGTKSTPYIVDAKGVIRGKLKWGEDLDAVVADLLKEMKK